MSAINGASSLLTAQRLLNFNSRAILGSLERLATGQRINRGSDDPAGLIASENLRATLAGLEAEVRSLQRADHVANVADGALGSTSDLLIEANGLVVAAANSAGMSAEERQALQGQLDSILATVNSISGNTSFNGQALLDGNQTLSVSGGSVSLPSTSTGNLGTTVIDGTTYTLANLGSGGSLNIVNGDLDAAQQVIGQAISDVATARGSVGSFQRHTVRAGINNTLTSIENIAAANSQIRDTDFAKEMVELSRSRLLHRATVQTMGIISATQGSILDLLG